MIAWLLISKALIGDDHDHPLPLELARRLGERRGHSDSAQCDTQEGNGTSGDYFKSTWK